MDASEPPRIVFESTASCADGGRAEGLVRQLLESARAPAPGWVITIRLAPGEPAIVTAEGEITDGAGKSRAREAITGDPADCGALGSAIGGWAVEALRTQQREEKPALPAAPPVLTPVAAPPPPATTAAEPPPAHALADRASPASLAPILSHAPPPREAVSEYEMPTLEAGMGGFLMVGGPAGGYAGVTPFLIDELAEGVFLRPSVAFGSAMSVSVSSTWLAGRVDTCTRLPGRYASRNGIQLDLCGGPDVGFSYVSSGTQPGTPAEGKLLPYVALGPSVDLRAEVGTLAVSLRAVSGFNVARKGFVDVAGKQVDEEPWSWRFELAFSASLHRSAR